MLGLCEYENMVVIDTGGETGIGRPIVFPMARNADQIVIFDIDANNARKIIKK